MPQSTNNEYYLFLDESGGFVEAVKTRAKTARSESEPSQVVGFLAPYRPDIGRIAQEIMEDVLESSRLPSGSSLHGTKLQNPVLNKLVEDLIPHLKANNWQPVRLVNKEQVEYGLNRNVNQTNVVAELILRLFQEKTRHAVDPMTIHMKFDWVSTGPKVGSAPRPHISAENFLRPIREYLGFAAVRRGLTVEQSKWILRGPLLEDAKKVPELQICDLLSNITYRDYDRCYPQIEHILRPLFGIYDQTMQTTDLVERLDELETGWHSYGRAIILLAESLYESESNSEGITNRLNHILDRLAQIGGRARDAQLHFIVFWLDEIIGQQRLLDAGHKITSWIQKRVIEPLRKKLRFFHDESSIDWFDFAVNRWAMTAANHRGRLLDADISLRKMNGLQLSLAGRWEHIPLLMEGFIAQAVHRADCFEFEKSIADMEWIAESLERQSKTLALIMPGEISEPLRYDLRAKALGTLTQSLILSGLKTDEARKRARKISDEAIDEFVNSEDKARQYQYRCHLETVAGDFGEARRFLSLSLNPHIEDPPSSHQAILAGIRREENKGRFNFRFALAHWLRIGSVAALRNDTEEIAEFLKYFDEPIVSQSAWFKGEIRDFPAHSILRFASVIQAFRGQTGEALRTLRKLHEVTKDNGESLILPMIEIAAFAEVAAILWGTTESSLLIDSKQNGEQTDLLPGTGLKQLLEAITAEKVGPFSSLGLKLDAWREKVDFVISNKTDKKTPVILLDMGSDVFY